jgi:integrase
VPRKKESLWRYSVGEKGYNRVTVYERRIGGPLHVEYWTPARKQETLKNLTGKALKDKDLARKIAHRMSEAQGRRREAENARILLGIPEPHTLGELLAEYHKAKDPEWSLLHRKDQKQLREFWTRRLGTDTPLNRIRAVEIEQHVLREPSIKAGRTKQKYLKYMVSAFYFAQKKLKWIGERENLSAVGMPKVRGESRAYDVAEIQAIVDAAPKVDPRLAAAVEMAWATGRRVSAIRTLQAGAYSGGWIQFPGATDKARRSGRAFLTESARAAVELLLQTPAVRGSGLLFPAGSLQDGSRRRQPISDEGLRKMLHRAEKLAEVEHIEGRAWHGMKRRFATVTEASSAAARQSGTDKRTLERHYEQDDPAPKQELARKLEIMRRKG